MGLFSLLSPGLHAQWTQQGPDIDGEAHGNQSGSSVSLSGDGTIVAIGAPYNAGGGTNRGHVRVYKNFGSTWIQQGADIDGEADNDQSGWSVSLSADGTSVAIGALGNNGFRGQVRVYKIIGGTWTQQGADIDGEASGDLSGFSVSLSADGGTVAIGAPYNNNSGTLRGHVRVYKNTGGAWIQQGADIDGEANADQSGYSVSLSSDGTTVAIGAPHNSNGGSSRGHVRVYKNIGGSWIQQGADIDGESNGDFSGISVSLSAGGGTVAIGAVNGGGSQKGQVRVYKNIGGSWTQQGADIDGEANDDQSGKSVSLSTDGTTLAIGAALNDGGGASNGHVRVYSYCSQTQQFLNAILAMAKQKGKKVNVCHQGIYNLQVSVSEFYFHLFHGDKLGKCEVGYCEGIELRGNDLEDFIGTEDDDAEGSMVLYPNPARQILNVKLPFHTDQAIQIHVYNSLGQSMINQPYSINGKDHAAIPVNIQKLPQGLYFLKASGERYEASRPFTKF